MTYAEKELQNEYMRGYRQRNPGYVIASRDRERARARARAKLSAKYQDEYEELLLKELRIILERQEKGLPR